MIILLVCFSLSVDRDAIFGAVTLQFWMSSEVSFVFFLGKSYIVHNAVRAPVIHVCSSLELWPRQSVLDSCVRCKSAFYWVSDSAHVARGARSARRTKLTCVCSMVQHGIWYVINTVLL